jgi:hypothetical protein
MDVVTAAAAAVCGGCRCRGGFVRPTWADFTPARQGASGVLFPEIFKVVRHGCRWRPLAFRRSSSALAAGRPGLPLLAPFLSCSLSLSRLLPWLAGRGPTALVALSLMVGGTSLAWRN